LRGSLVIGADGRRSTIARLVATNAYRSEPSGRACFYAYWHDPDATWRHVAAQWREGAELGTAFPCDGGLTLVLLQPPAARAKEFTRDLEGTYRRTIAAIPPLAERLEGGQLASKVRSATAIESYFRRSSGPGWALAGDAGHFKDPVTAQGIRDALRFGRLLADDIAPVLDDPARLDRALRASERRREQACLETYQWTNIFARGEAMSPLELELYRHAERSPRLARELADVFSRVLRPGQVFTARRGLRYATLATIRRPGAATHIATTLWRDLATALRDQLERLHARFAPLPSLPPSASPHGRSSEQGRRMGEPAADTLARA
jgi:2-polyprenyl-6-methoxyphenol hydroxylase-like FAD-dependent oxidoreductase